MSKSKHYFLDLNKVKCIVLLKDPGDKEALEILEYCPNYCPKCKTTRLKHVDFFIEYNVLYAKNVCENCSYMEKGFHSVHGFRNN